MARSRDSFADFVRQQQPRSRDEQIDWDRLRIEWIQSIEELYAQIETFLGEYVKSGQITTGRTNKYITEENIGTYNIPQMILNIGNQRVILEPQGRFVIGAKGRVDIIGPRGRARLLLTDAEARGPMQFRIVHADLQHVPVAADEIRQPASWAWKIVTEPPNIEFSDLTQQSLFDLLMSVVNG